MNRKAKFREGLSRFYLPRYDALCAILPDQWQPICGIRSFDDQADLYARGRTRPGEIVTRAKPGLSYHQYGLATDWGYFDDDGRYICPEPGDPLWKPYIDACSRVGLQLIKWEKPHNQLPIPVPIRCVLDVYKTGMLDAVDMYLERILNGNANPDPGSSTPAA